MIEILRRLLSPEYWVASEPGPLGRLWVVYVALGILFSAGLSAALWLLAGPGRRQRPPAQRAYAWFELWICLTGLGAVAGRFLGWPGWSARIWPVFLAFLALAGTAAYRLRRVHLPRWLVDQARILLFALPPAPRQGVSHPDPLPERDGLCLDPESGEDGPRAGMVALVPTLAGLGVHLAGIALVAETRWHLPYWTAPFLLLVLVLPQAPLVLRRRFSLMALTPLLPGYLAVLLWLLYHNLDVTIIGWQGLSFPNPMVSLLYTDGILLACAVYSVLCQLSITSSGLGRPASFWRWTAGCLLLAVLIWSSMVYLGKRTHGATASDPYAYAQMGIDLAQRGILLHRFPLTAEISRLQIPLGPALPYGYHLPRNQVGDAPSVWATGAAVLLAAGYKLLGEPGLYVTTPLIALLLLMATWALVQEALHGEPPSVRYAAGAIAVALTAASPEQVDRLLVPMADAQAQLFTVLTLFFALRAMRTLGTDPGQAAISLSVSGLAFGWAYWVRHTQLVLAIPVALGLILAGRLDRGRQRPATLLSRLWPLLLFLGAGLLAAMPDIVYRWRVFGSPLATETTELPAMRLQYVGPIAWQVLRDVLVAGEWGYLFPLGLVGGYCLTRNHRRVAAVLGLSVVGILLVHFTYRFLRLRDLLSLFPLLNLAVGYGAVTLVRSVCHLARIRDRSRRLGPVLLGVGAIGWVMLSLSLARWTMIYKVWEPGWASFGYVRADQRAAFDRLAELTAPNAVIGASLNAGAVMMYTARDAVRPYEGWDDAEWDLFLSAMHARARPVYLLDDGRLMTEFIDSLDGRYRLAPVEPLAVPLFEAPGRETGWLYLLEPAR